MYIQRNKSKHPNGKVYRSVLLCHKYRDDGKIKTKTIANLSKLPQEMVLTIENLLKNKKEALLSTDDLVVEKSYDFGYLAIILFLVKELRVKEVFDKVSPEITSRILLIIIGKLITTGSKLEIYNWITRNPQIAGTIGADITKLKVDDLYQALGAASFYQPRLEKKWFTYNKGTHKEIYLYDITSTYLEGTKNELAAFGYNRDGKKGKMQICIGLVTDSEGFPLSIEAFEGNISDQKTVLRQIDKLKSLYGTEQVIFVGDRGMKIRYNLEQLGAAEKNGVQYITGLEHKEIQSLVQDGVIQLSLFSPELAEVQDQNQRYILSLNPELQESERAFLKKQQTRADSIIEQVFASWQKRDGQNTTNLEKLKQGHKNKKLVTKFSKEQLDKYTVRLDRELRKCMMRKYYSFNITDQNFEVSFNYELYNKNYLLAGKYVICTNVGKEKIDKETVRMNYKGLQKVEHAFRDLKSDNIQIRPIFHRNEPQTRGHIFISMFAYAVIKTMEDKIYPWLKQKNEKDKTKLSFADIINEMKNVKICMLNIGKGVPLKKVTKLNPIQKEVFELLGLNQKDIEKMM